MNLKRADAGRQVDNAAKLTGIGSALNGKHQGMCTQPEVEIEHDRAVFNQHITVARLPVNDSGRLFMLGNAVQNRIAEWKRFWWYDSSGGKVKLLNGLIHMTFHRFRLFDCDWTKTHGITRF